MLALEESPLFFTRCLIEVWLFSAGRLVVAVLTHLIVVLLAIAALVAPCLFIFLSDLSTIGELIFQYCWLCQRAHEHSPVEQVLAGQTLTDLSIMVALAE